jgi:hypothetical protein
MSNLARIAIAAAAVLAIAVVGYNFLPGGGGPGGPDPSPSQTATALPTATPQPTGPIVLPAASLTAGETYRVSNGFSVGSHPLTFTVPGTDWFAIDASAILGKDVLPPENWYDIAFSIWIVGNVFADSCHWRGSELEPAVGPTIDDLATALAAQAGRSGSSPTDVTVGGYAGKKVELSVPSNLDPATCDGGDLRTWIPAGNANGYGGHVYGSGQKNSVYILDVAGERLVLDTMYLPGTSDANLAELAQLMDSIRIEP